jgi:prephenate dehydrogenase
VARTRPDLVATWCDRNPALVLALDDVIARLQGAREHLAAAESMYDLARAGHAARTGWEERRFEPVELRAELEQLCEHGRLGGWITAVLREPGRDEAGPDAVRLLGMRPVG